MFKAEKLIQKVKNDYNLIAEHFSQNRIFPWTEFNDFRIYLKNGQRVLDLGCGNGRLYFSFLKDYDLEYHGIDFSERLIADAEFRISNLEFRNYKFQVGDITKIPFENNYFDVVFCIAAFHHLPIKELRRQTLWEIKRVLKPKGYLIMSNWYWWQEFPLKYFFNKFWQKRNFKDLFIPWKNPQGKIITHLYYHAFTKKELEKLINDSGLRIERIYLSGDRQEKRKKSKINLVVIGRK